MVRFGEAGESSQVLGIGEWLHAVDLCGGYQGSDANPGTAALFAGHDAGAENWAVIAGGHPQSRIDDLLPWNYPVNV